MRFNRAILSAAAAVLFVPNTVWAQASSGEAACAEIVAEALADCSQLAADEARLQQLSSSVDNKTKNALEIAQISADIATRSAKPLTQFPGFCTSVSATTPRTCDALATRLSVVADSEAVQSLATSTQVEEVAKTRPLAREAAAADRQTSTNKSGSSAQIDPVESIQPITLAGGAITLSGTRSGTKGVGTITINPLALTVPDDAVAGRMFDLTVSAPFDLDRGTSENRRYASARLRVNLTAPISAAELNQKFSDWLNSAGRYADTLEEVLEQAIDVHACVDSITRNHIVSKDACARDLDSAAMRKARDLAYAEVLRAQRAADSYYAGVDIRFDTGDQTGPDVVGDNGTHLLGGLAAGVRLSQGALWDWELRGRAAGDYFQSRDDAAGADPDPVYSFDWGLAFIFSGRLKDDAKQRMAFGVGVEGRQASKTAEADLAPTNYANLNMMAIVPAVNGGDIGLAISIPLADSKIPRGALINFSTDLGLLDHSAE